MIGFCFSYQDLDGFHQVCYHYVDKKIENIIQRKKPLCFELRKCTYEKTTEANRLIAQYEYVDYYALYPNKYWILRKIPIIMKAAEKLNTNDFTDLQIESGYTDYAMDTINFYLHKLGLVKSYDPRVKKFDFDKEAIEKWKYYKCSPYWQLYNEAGYKVV